jgi:putative transcriptional regulator
MLKTGKIIIAKPFLLDPFFKRSVIILTEHNTEGSVGFILNKPLDINIADISTVLPINDNIYYGGPVNNDIMFTIHTFGDLIEGSIPIIKGLYWGGKIDIIKKYIEEGITNENNMRFFIGYAGWSKGQLEHELTENSWFVADFNSKFIMGTEPRSLWRQALINMGDKYAQYANYPENPIYN